LRAQFAGWKVASVPEHAPQSSYRYFPIAKRDRNWGLFITTVGESHFGPGCTAYPPAGHPKGYGFLAPEGRLLDEYQVIYISAGSGWFRSAASGRVKINAGSVIFLFPGVWHSYGPAAGTGWNEHWVGFNGEMAQRWVRHRFFTPGQPVLRAGEENKLLGLFSSLMESTRSNHPALQQIMAGTTESVLALLYSAQQSTLAGDDSGLQVIHQALARMREAGGTVLSMPDLASDLKVGYRWFRRAFAHHTGLSPHQYSLDIRLTRARDLLAQTSLPIKEIGARLGFEEPQYFCKLFHKKVGLTPGDWRAQARKGNLTGGRSKAASPVALHRPPPI
jgi:AraC-like DNA-binding protein